MGEKQAGQAHIVFEWAGVGKQFHWKPGSRGAKDLPVTKAYFCWYREQPC